MAGRQNKNEAHHPIREVHIPDQTVNNLSDIWHEQSTLDLAGNVPSDHGLETSKQGRKIDVISLEKLEIAMQWCLPHVGSAGGYAGQGDKARVLI